MVSRGMSPNVASRQYLWNSGIFAFTVRTIRREIARHLPRLAHALAQLEESLRTGTYEQTLEAVYGQVEAISIDYGIMEKTKEAIYVLPVAFGWSDVGSWQAVHELRAHEHDEGRNMVIGEAMLVDTRDSLIYSQTGRLIAVLGLERVMIVDTGCPPGRRSRALAGGAPFPRAVEARRPRGVVLKTRRSDSARARSKASGADSQ